VFLSPPRVFIAVCSVAGILYAGVRRSSSQPSIPDANYYRRKALAAYKEENYAAALAS